MNLRPHPCTLPRPPPRPIDAGELRKSEARARLEVAALQKQLEVRRAGGLIACFLIALPILSRLCSILTRPVSCDELAAPSCLHPLPRVGTGAARMCAQHAPHALLTLRLLSQCVCPQGHELQSRVAEARAEAATLRRQLEEAAASRHELQGSVVKLTTQVRSVICVICELCDL